MMMPPPRIAALGMLRRLTRIAVVVMLRSPTRTEILPLMVSGLARVGILAVPMMVMLPFSPSAGQNREDRGIHHQGRDADWQIRQNRDAWQGAGTGRTGRRGTRRRRRRGPGCRNAAPHGPRASRTSGVKNGFQEVGYGHFPHLIQGPLLAQRLRVTLPQEVPSHRHLRLFHLLDQ